MASIEEVRAAIAQAVDKAGQSAAALQQAADLAKDAQALLSQATEGSDQADVDQANAQFAEVANGVDDLQKFLANGISQAENISARL
ncbi:hypothetical protein [Saccharothrix violaceirubra]|uniref:Putative phage infection (PIP) family protein YhgE n=1 Tax=Saccharothrix violaceirubra TaxID=413306 RepID=A0A7W7WYL7_9PSEU|nr:hypothetical protein [Saccharothrix violaceirubra]MBB4968674.1 putative phage infection (PIP) family protein YhgE [Saccharothrix violaceirubra]